jgi:sugar transferase EpsL
LKLDESPDVMAGSSAMLKRLFDICAATIILVAMSPVFLLVALAVRFEFGRPILFSQNRPGLHGKLFKIYKFRTMHATTDKNGEMLPDAMRLCLLGKLLRSTSLDEFPELWNVLKGEMSLVGPRPLLIEYIPIYSREQHRRHDVLPGITGWAQINGRNDISWKRKFELDVWYVDNRSFWLDMKIFFLTSVRVLKRTGISKKGHSTTDSFNGMN